MKKILITEGTQVIELEALDRPQFLQFVNISDATEIKAVLVRVAVDDEKIIDPIGLVACSEAQSKIQDILEGRSIVPVVIDKGGEGNIVRSVEVQLSIGGEIPLSINDKIVITLSKTGVHKKSAVFLKGASSQSNILYKMRSNLYNGKAPEQNLDVSDFDFLVFGNSDETFPQEIVTAYDGDRDVLTRETYLVQESLDYGVVVSEESVSDINVAAAADPVRNISVQNIKSIYGTNKIIVVDVRNLLSLYLKDDRKNDIDFHYVKFN